jgi:mannose-6-phosphate isomerase-like protein (cupin superfamily)
MVLRKSSIEEVNGRRPYPLGDRQVSIGHFVARTTTPENPFSPHEHEKPEMWYIAEGKALVTLDNVEEQVEAGDLVVIDPWVKHGLRTNSQVVWICLG